MMKENKIRYSILKTRKNKGNPFQSLNEIINDREAILEQGNFLSREGYITSNHYADDTIHKWGDLTEKGEKYLKENSKSGISIKFLKELKSWIPFIK